MTPFPQPLAGSLRHDPVTLRLASAPATHALLSRWSPHQTSSESVWGVRVPVSPALAPRVCHSIEPYGTQQLLVLFLVE